MSRGHSPGGPRRCSPPRAPSCAGAVSPRSSTSTRSRCTTGAGPRDAARLARMSRPRPRPSRSRRHDHDEHDHDARPRRTTTSQEAEAEQRARRQIALSQIRQYGDPVLRMRANEVESFDEELHEARRADDRCSCTTPTASGSRRPRSGSCDACSSSTTRARTRASSTPCSRRPAAEIEVDERRLSLARPGADACRALRRGDARGRRRRRRAAAASSSKGCRPASSSTSSTISTAS